MAKEELVVKEVEQALDRLYGVDLDEFIPTRTQLAKELKNAGEKAAAETIAAARKPTVAGWVLNQLARQRRKDIDLLLDAGHRLRQAQASLLRGEEPSAFAAARKVEQTTVAKLAKEARSLLADRGAMSQTTIDQVTQSLRAAAVSEDGRQLLAQGRFEKPLSEAAGFDALAEIAPKGPAQRRTARKMSERDALREAKAELREAQRHESTCNGKQEPPKPKQAISRNNSKTPSSERESHVRQRTTRPRLSSGLSAE